MFTHENSGFVLLLSADKNDERALFLAQSCYDSHELVYCNVYSA